MNDPNSVRRQQLRRSRATQRDRDYDTFRETLAAPMPNRSYRSQIELIDARPTAAEQIIRLAAVILGALLIGRLITHLYTTSPDNGYISFFQAATNWLVWPFQLIFGRAPVSATGGYFDWPAVIALVVLCLAATLVIRLIRPRQP